MPGRSRRKQAKIISERKRYDALIVHHIFQEGWPDDAIHGLVRCLSKHRFKNVFYVDKKFTNPILVNYLDRYKNWALVCMNDPVPMPKTSKIFWTGYQWPYCTHDTAPGSINFMLRRGYGIHSSPSAIFDGDFKPITSEDLEGDTGVFLQKHWNKVYDDVYFIDSPSVADFGY